MSHWTRVFGGQFSQVRHRTRLYSALLFFLAFRAETVRLAGQGKPAGTKAPGPSQAGAEISEHEQPTTFQVRVNLVLARVVVRDTQGHALGNLHEEDFRLFDEGKPQQITKFSVEQTSSAPATAHIEAEASESAKSSPASNPVIKPEH